MVGSSIPGNELLARKNNGGRMVRARMVGYYMYHQTVDISPSKYSRKRQVMEIKSMSQGASTMFFLYLKNL